MTGNCVYCKVEVTEGSPIEVCQSCGLKVWGEKMFQAIIDNMENAKEVGDLYQGSVSEGRGTDGDMERREEPTNVETGGVERGELGEGEIVSMESRSVELGDEGSGGESSDRLLDFNRTSGESMSEESGDKAEDIISESADDPFGNVNRFR